MDFVPSWFLCNCTYIQPFEVGLCHGIHGIPFPLYCRGGVFLMKRAEQTIYSTPLLSEPSESQESGNHQNKTSNSVGICTRLARPVIQ